MLSNFRFYLYDKFIKTCYNGFKLYDVFISLSNNDLFLNYGLIFIVWNNYYDDDLYIHSMGYRYDMLMTIGIKKMAKINFLSFILTLNVNILKNDKIYIYIYFKNVL